MICLNSWALASTSPTRALYSPRGAGADLAAALNAPLDGVLVVFEEFIAGFSLRVAIASLAACSAALAIIYARGCRGACSRRCS